MNIDKKRFTELFENYVNTFSPTGLGMRNNKIDDLNKYKFIEAIDNSNYIVMKGSRQIGLSSMLATYCAMNRNKEIVYFTTNKKCGKNFLDRIDKIEPDVKVKPNNMYERGNVKVIAPSADAFCSQGFDILIIDSASFIENLDEIAKTFLPVLSTKGKLIVTSTPNKPEGWFYKIFTDAEAGKNNFFPVSFKNWMDEAHIQEMKKIYGNMECVFKREVLGEFTPDDKRKMSTIPAIRIENELFNNLKYQVAINRTTVSKYIRNLIEKDLNKIDKNTD